MVRVQPDFDRTVVFMHMPRPALEIAVAVGVKLALLALLYVFFFAPSKRPEIDDHAVSRHLLGGSGGETQ